MLDLNKESLASEASDKEVNTSNATENHEPSNVQEKTEEETPKALETIEEPNQSDQIDQKGDELEDSEPSKSSPDKKHSLEKEELKPVTLDQSLEEEKKDPSADQEEENAEKDEVVSEDEGKTADSKSEKGTTESVPIIDVAKLSLDELAEAVATLLQGFEIKDIKNQIESIKIEFQKKFRILVKEKKEAFIEEGGQEVDFFYSSTVKSRFDDLIREFKRKKQQYYKDLERQQNINLETRLMLIDELKDLIDNAEASTMYKNFRNLQDRWREIGQIPHTKYNDVWRTYHHHVERFYDLLHLNNDFRDLDFKHNLEEKNKLIERAEALAQSDDLNHAFKELQILHRLWKEDIGPVAREKREEVWNKFSEATKQIHKKRHEFQDKLEEKYRANVDLKLAVIEKIKNLKTEKLNSHKLWQEQIATMESLRNDFFAVGKVPRSRNEEIWQLFREATRSFNAAKNNFYKGLKKSQLENLKKKEALVEKAEELKDSEEWAIATEVYKKIQAEWKTIGHVPRRDSDKIWKRFKAACNHYFDRLHEKQNGLDKDQAELIEKKKKFMESFKAEIDKGKELSRDFVEDGLKQWRELGVLPHKMKHIDSKFFKLIDTAYKKLNIDKVEAGYLRFKSSVDDLFDHKNTRKLDSEQLFIRRKIEELTKEIKQLENNISFISNASEDNPLVKNVYKNIEESKAKLEVWKKKIEYIRNLDY